MTNGCRDRIRNYKRDKGLEKVRQVWHPAIPLDTGRPEGTSLQ
jgi:hypothetical protein